MCMNALVFDTNFIIENRGQLKEIVANLNNGEFTVYVTQISIDERIAQRYLELKKKYEKLEAIANECKNIVSIRMKATFEKRFEAEKDFVQKGYFDFFGEHIIPFSSEVVFPMVLDRVFKKVPPFSPADGASDKGFKDTLIWLSLLEYFKSNGENEVVFITNDKGFRNNSDVLCREFKEYTGKTIVIEDNSYYFSLMGVRAYEAETPKEEYTLPDVNQIRDRIHEVIDLLCYVYSYDPWGNQEWERTFTLNQRVDSDYMEYVFKHLKRDIRDNLFETEIPANKILGLDDRITNGVPIPTWALDDALSLYEEIQHKLPDYLPQFYSAVATIINGNYIEPQEDVGDFDIPF